MVGKWGCKADTARTDSHRRFLNTLTISVAIIWELAIKTTKPQNPLTLSDPLDVYLAKCLPTYGIDVLPIRQAHALGVLALPDYHRDPFDRIMIAHPCPSVTSVVQMKLRWIPRPPCLGRLRSSIWMFRSGTW